MGIAAVAAESAQQMASVCQGWAGCRVGQIEYKFLSCHLETGVAKQRQLQSASLCHMQVDKDLRTMLVKPDAPSPQMVGVRVWPRANPQFNVGHLDTLEVWSVARCA